MLITWVSAQPFAQKTRSSLVSVGAKHRSVYSDDDLKERQKKPLYFTPWNGSFFFMYKNHLLQFRCLQKEDRFSQEEISVSCIGRSPEVLREFFRECRTEYLKLIRKKTSVFEHRDGDWTKTKARDIRPISTVIMNEKEKKNLLKDIEDFLDEGARGWYARRGIPYRRGFLLYGPPGTGKSSFSLSVAGCFELDIYVLNLSCVDDSSLNSLFSQLPPHCVILLEDVDAAGTARTEQPEATENSSEVMKGPPTKAKSQGRLSLSGLLNALDGVSSQEGRVLIMTTNHIEHLDDALIRPGRVDRKVFFHLADKDMNSQLFCTVFKQSDEDRCTPEKPVDDEIVKRLADEFAGKVPEQVFSPAEILSFLLEHKQSPTNAVANVEEWVAKAKEERVKLKTENFWAEDA